MSRIPVDKPYVITTQFGEYVGNAALFGKHSGIDYGVPIGRQVFAPATGVVIFADFDTTGGNMVILFDGQYYHRLMHNSKLYVQLGQRVTEGQHVSDSGTSGLSTGPHVHWDVCNKLKATSFADFIDPNEWLKGDNVAKDNLTREEIQVIYSGFTLDEGATEDHIAAWLGKSLDDYLQYLQGNQDIQNLRNGYKQASNGEYIPVNQLYVKKG